MSDLKRSRALPVISIVTFIGFLDTHLLIPIMALFASGMGAGVGTVGVIVGLYSITNTPANIVFGRLVDRYGYRFPLIAGLIGDALSMFLYSLSRLPIHLALVRMFHGAAGGMVGPATMSAIAHHSGKGRGRAMAFYGVSLGMATLVGYGLSGLIASRLGYNAVFWAGGGLLIIGVVVSVFLPGGGKNRLIEPEASAGSGWQKAKDLLRRRGLVVPYCAIFAQYFTFGGVVTLLPLYVRGLGMEAFHVGIMLAAFALAFIIVQMPAGRLSDRLGRLVPTAIGLILGATALILIPITNVLSLLIMLMVLYGVAYGAIFPSISAMVTDYTAPDERGLGTGIFHALLTGGVAIGAPVMGWVGGTAGVQAGLMLTAVIMILALIVIIVVGKRI